MGDHRLAGSNETNNGGVNWSEISCGIFGSPRDMVGQGLQTIADGSAAVQKVATAAGAMAECATEGSLKLGSAALVGTAGVVADAIGGKKAGDAMRSGASSAIDRIGDIVDNVTQSALGGPQASVIEKAASAVGGALSSGAATAIGKAAAKIGKSELKEAERNQDPQAKPAAPDVVIPAEQRLGDAIENASRRFVEELIKTPSDVYDRVRNNPLRSMPAALLGGFGGLIIDAKLASFEKDK